MWIEKNIVIINKCRGFHLITDEIELNTDNKRKQKLNVKNKNIESGNEK